MFKRIRIWLFLALVAVFCMPQPAFAIGEAMAAAGWGSDYTILANVFGTNFPTADTVFTPSNAVQIMADVDSTGAYFHVVGQHRKGTRIFGIHSNRGGGMYYRAVTAPGTWTAGDLPAAVSSAANTDFLPASWNNL